MRKLLFILFLLPLAALGQMRGVFLANSNQSRVIQSVTTIVDDGVRGTAQNQFTFSKLPSGTPAWTYVTTGSPLSYLGTHSYSQSTDDIAEIDFVGYAIELYGELYNNKGITAYSIDGGTETMVDLYSAGFVYNSLLYSSSISVGAIANGPHTLRIRVTGTKNASSSQFYTDVDYAKIFTNGSTPATDPGTGDWFVSSTGIDTNSGTSAILPFLTLAKAASVAVSGDIIKVGPGTYRETVVPPSGTIWVATDQATTIISGLEVVGTTGWTVDAGSVYKKTINLGAMFTEKQTGFDANSLQTNNTELLAQQIFKDGVYAPLASYPKYGTPDKLLDRASFRSTVHASSITTTSITDNNGGVGFNQFNSLAGGIVTTMGWFIEATRTISSHTNGSSTISYPTTYDTQFNKFYRVSASRNLLTTAGEWHYDAAGGGTLYYWQVGGGSPTGLEYKKRNWGFDIRGKTYVTIMGFSFIGCDPVMSNSSSSNATIDNIRATYTSHHLLETDGGAVSTGYANSCVQTGSKILGPNSVLKNSEFNYASGVTVWAGSDVTIQNNKFGNGDYGGFYSSFIKLAFSGTTGTNNVKILNNTFYRSGRGSIELTGVSNNITHTNLEIANNDFSKFIMVSVDGGAIYSARRTILSNARAHHNWFHNDGGFDEGGTGQQSGIQVNGIYFDQAGGGMTIDHNVHWNGISGASRSGAYSADFYVQGFWYETFVGGTSNANSWMASPNKFYNNTFVDNTGGGSRNYVNYHGHTYYNGSGNVTSPTPPGYDAWEVQRNNIYRNSNWINPSGVEAGDINGTNTTSGTNPLFVTGSGFTDGRQYQIQSGSPARGIGTSVSGITTGEVGPIDAGAYDYEATPWVAGYSAVTYTPTP